MSKLIKKILIADDSIFTRDAINNLLTNDYEIICAKNGLEVLQLVSQNQDIACIIMDITMPHLDGLKTTYILKSQFTTYHIPIIMLTSQPATQDMANAVEMGADDYMRKPFDEQELKARIIMNLRRTERDQNANPLTKLPGASVINRLILARLNQPLALLYADLDNFKAYNDKYGFSTGDTVIYHTASLLSHAVTSNGNQNDFLGHIGGDDFIILTTPEKADLIAKTACQEFDKTILSFYSKQDQDLKKVVSCDRRGTITEFPIMSISIAIVTNEHKELTSLPQVAQLAAELKHYAKSKPSGILASNYVKDRRS